MHKPYRQLRWLLLGLIASSGVLVARLNATAAPVNELSAKNVVANVVRSGAARPLAVNWSPASNLSATGDKSVFPSVASDAGGKMHVAWLEYDAEGVQSSRVFYTNNINGSFRPAHLVAVNGGKNASHMVALTTEGDRVHVFFTDQDKALRHQIVILDAGEPRNDRGLALSPEGARGYAPSATVDTQGRVHAAWIDNRDSGRYQVYHRMWTREGWEPESRPVRPTGDNQNHPSIVATQDGLVHMVYKGGRFVGYSFFDGNYWQASTNPGPDAPNQTYLATDGNLLYVTWSVSAGQHYVYATYGVSGNWAPPIMVSDPGQFGDFPSIFWSSGESRAYVLWSTGPETNRLSIAVRPLVAYGEVGPPLIIGSAPATWARGAGSAAGLVTVWQDKSAGSEEIMVSIAALSAIPPVILPTPAPQPQPTAPPETVPAGPSRTFPETNQVVFGRLLEYWNGNGGLAIFGLPLGAQAAQQTSDGVFELQQFERNRLELHPANQRPYDVLLGRLGADALARQGRPWETLPKEEAKRGCKFFPQTGFNLCEPFLSYWRTHGLDLGDRGTSERESLALFGYPISGVQVEQNSSGDQVPTQWFERARFEEHARNRPPYNVLLGRLGAETP